MPITANRLAEARQRVEALLAQLPAPAPDAGRPMPIRADPAADAVTASEGASR